MSKPAIRIKGLSKAYMIGHEREAAPGTMTFRDSLANTVRKPIELITGHQLKKEKFWALKDIDLEIQKGDVVGIIGRNGSGKSTLLKVLSRIVEPTKGEVIMNGRVASLLEVGTGFHPELTGRENVFFNGAILGMSRKEVKAKFDEIVAFSEVEKFLDTPVKFYSSGMYVRLAFAVAAHLDPDVLIVDEVLAVGDSAFQKKCLGKMKEVAGQGRTVLYVSHSLPSIKQLCNKGVLLQNGAVLAQGIIEDVTRRYLDTLSSGSELGSIWSNPSSQDNDLLTVLSASICKDDNKPVKKALTTTDKAKIILNVDLHENNPGLTIGYSLVNSSGDTIFWSYFNDSKQHPSIKTGQHQLESYIPINFLTEGEYFIQIIGGVHNQRWLYEPGHSKANLKFELLRDESTISSLNNLTRPTILSPVIKWRIK